MLLRPRWLGLPMLLALVACDATHASLGDGGKISMNHERTESSDSLPLSPPSSSVADELPGKTDAATKPANTVNIGLGDTSRSIGLEIGQVLRISLPASPATQYDWVLEDGVPPLLRMDADPGKAPAGSPYAEDMQSWAFRAEQPGRAELRFGYRRSWDARSFPILTARFNVVVH